jgi:hypothetical protein
VKAIFMTDELLESLTTDLVPVSDWYVVRRLIIGAGVGAALSAALMVSTLGLRPDFRHVVSAGVFWLKTVVYSRICARCWVCS